MKHNSQFIITVKQSVEIIVENYREIYKDIYMLIHE